MTDALLDEILDEIELTEPKCARCGRSMVTQKQWGAAGQEERWELWQEGYESYGRSDRKRCNPCSYQAGPLREDELAVRDERRFRVLRYKALLEEGVTDLNEAAARLGITRPGLVRNIKNWKNRGWL